MQKEAVLQEVRRLAAQHLITREEVLAVFDRSTEGSTDVALTRQAGISDILYYIGAAIVFLGISVLIWQHWSILGDATKILSTVGSGIAAYLTATLLSRNERFEVAASAFYFISALVSPLGLYVTFDVAGLDAGSAGVQSLSAAILLATYVLSYAVNRKTVFIIFNIIFGTWFFFSFTSYLVGSNPYFNWEFSAYRVLCAGLVYALLGYHFSQSGKRALTGALYGFGVFCFLGAALALGDWKPNQNVWWELAFPGLVFGVMFLSVYLKSKSFLTFGSMYLMAYIVKITAEYFADSLGWPLALVFTGLALVVVGYVHMNVKSKYLS